MCRFGNGLYINFYTTGGTSLSSVQTLTPGNWYHVACVYDGSKKSIYINGVENASLGVTVPTWEVDNYELGRSEKNNAQSYTGIIDLPAPQNNSDILLPSHFRYR